MRSLSSALERFMRRKAVEQFVSEFGYHPIRLQDRISKNAIQCNICNRRCRVTTYDFGLCNAVFNAGDGLISTSYGILAQSLDSIEHIERVGFLHYKPGMSILCPINLHCNFRCVFCYQSGWSHTKPRFYISDNYISPHDIIEVAKAQGAEGIAFSMAEPTMLFDFVVDTALLAKEAGLDVIVNSNGYMTPEAIDLLAPVIDAISISVKGLGDIRMYNKWLLTGPANPAYVLQSIKLFYERGVHVEVTGIFTRQDCEVETNPRSLSAWLASNVDRQIPFVLLPLRPWALNQPLELFRVSYKESNGMASVCRRSGLQYVYNFASSLKSNAPPDIVTRCHKCGNVLVKRNGKITEQLDDLSVALVYIPDVRGLNVIDDKGYCKRCNTKIYGAWRKQPNKLNSRTMILPGTNRQCSTCLPRMGEISGRQK